MMTAKPRVPSLAREPHHRPCGEVAAVHRDPRDTVTDRSPRPSYPEHKLRRQKAQPPGSIRFALPNTRSVRRNLACYVDVKLAAGALGWQQAPGIALGKDRRALHLVPDLDGHARLAAVKNGIHHFQHMQGQPAARMV